MAKTDVKQRILQEGAALVHTKGFSSTGIQEVLEAADVPKGSFYHYFRNKDDFGLQVIDFNTAILVGMAEQILGDDAVAPLERIRRFFDGFRCMLDGMACKAGCPIGNLAQEMGTRNEAFRSKLAESVSRMKATLQTCLDQARARGDIGPEPSTTDLADFIFNSFEGVLIAVKLEDDTRPLQTFERIVFDVLLT